MVNIISKHSFTSCRWWCGKHSHWTGCWTSAVMCFLKPLLMVSTTSFWCFLFWLHVCCGLIFVSSIGAVPPAPIATTSAPLILPVKGFHLGVFGFVHCYGCGGCWVYLWGAWGYLEGFPGVICNLAYLLKVVASGYGFACYGYFDRGGRCCFHIPITALTAQQPSASGLGLQSHIRYAILLANCDGLPFMTRLAALV